LHLIAEDVLQFRGPEVVTVKRLPTGATDEEIERAVLTVIDEEMGITSGTSVLDFSSYGISNAVKEAVPDVSQVFPSLTFYNEVSFRDTSAKVMEFGNEIHHPPQTSGIGVKLEKVSPTSYRVTPSTVGSVSLVTTPVVPELRVIRNQYFEVRTRKVKVVR
jgi:hypothetical protein